MSILRTIVIFVVNILTAAVIGYVMGTVGMRIIGHSTAFRLREESVADLQKLVAPFSSFSWAIASIFLRKVKFIWSVIAGLLSPIIATAVIVFFIYSPDWNGNGKGLITVFIVIGVLFAYLKFGIIGLLTGIAVRITELEYAISKFQKWKAD